MIMFKCGCYPCGAVDSKLVLFAYLVSQGLGFVFGCKQIFNVADQLMLFSIFAYFCSSRSNFYR